MSAARTTPRVVRVRSRGAFGLDERRRPAPARVEAELRAYLAGRLPEVWPLPGPAESEDGGRTVTLLLASGHAAVLRIEPTPDAPGAATVALMARCRLLRIPHALVSSLDEGLAALRRLGVEPRRTVAGPTIETVFGRR